MRKTILTCLLGLGLTPAFANYTSYGPTEITNGIGGVYVNCKNIYFATVCVQHNGPETYPQSGDVIEVWSDGEFLGTAVIKSFKDTDPNPSVPPEGSDEPQIVEGVFQVEKFGQ